VEIVQQLRLRFAQALAHCRPLRGIHTVLHVFCVERLIHYRQPVTMLERLVEFSRSSLTPWYCGGHCFVMRAHT